jgi:hypothetical protein
VVSVAVVMVVVAMAIRVAAVDTAVAPEAPHPVPAAGKIAVMALVPRPPVTVLTRAVPAAVAAVVVAIPVAAITTGALRVSQSLADQ